MTTDEAIKFLQDHPRIPAEASQAIIDRLDAVRQHLSEHPDARCIPYVLGVFGDHMGWGIFQLFDDVLRHYTSEQLAPHLIAALLSEHRGTRWWAAHWAMEWPRVELLPALLRVLESREDEDAHCFCLAALGEIYTTTGDARAIDYLRERAARETDPERRQLLDELLNTTA
jgi:HEAT repeats